MLEPVSYETAETSRDPDELAAYVIQGIVDNHETNGGSISDWENAAHAMDVYLAHNTTVDDTDLLETKAIVQKFLDSKK